MTNSELLLSITVLLSFLSLLTISNRYVNKVLQISSIILVNHLLIKTAGSIIIFYLLTMILCAFFIISILTIDIKKLYIYAILCICCVPLFIILDIGSLAKLLTSIGTLFLTLGLLKNIKALNKND